MVVIKTTFSNPTERPYSIPMCWRWGQAEKKWNRKEWRKPKTMAYASTFFIHLTSFSSWPWWPVTKSTFHSNRLQTYHSTWHVKSLEHKSGEHSPITMKHAHDDDPFQSWRETSWSCMLFKHKFSQTHACPLNQCHDRNVMCMLFKNVKQSLTNT